MKGIVFDILRDMVEESYGLEGWNSILEKSGSNGLYISTESYKDDELFSLVGAASEITGIAVNDLVFKFGEYMVSQFYSRFPIFFDRSKGLIDFLLSIDRIVHLEVRKLYPDANLPSFNYQKGDDSSLTMIYRSERKLCRLAEGLISGSAKFFNQTYTMNHDPCMHHGADACHLKIQLTGEANGI
ncbi:heme NO-binding domain-containing protein [Thalassolituus sp.]|uniref:heme NO-binding domain-containing protein n=1 Tax=Thalassolituus sp. TaxID=2030822 RepID=UPI002A82688E|nr:heme NO-binding domain-containing protein [Thalassolituus sp.]|tara:strand:- start:116 stop:670 length:555 start_codon:yes stop_codon:yes gene_type:complete